MRQLLLMWALLVAVYFLWRYLPPRPKFFVWQFIKSHLPWVGFFLALIFVGLFMQAGTTTKLF